MELARRERRDRAVEFVLDLYAPSLKLRAHSVPHVDTESLKRTVECHGDERRVRCFDAVPNLVDILSAGMRAASRGCEIK